jgi:ATP-dependent RNA helicase DeaD
LIQPGAAVTGFSAPIPAAPPATAPVAPRGAKVAPGWAKTVASPKDSVAEVARGHGAPAATRPARPAAPRPAAESPADHAPAPTALAPSDTNAESADEEFSSAATRKPKYERPARTGRESGMATIFLNIGRKQLITPADIVGKISGVTRLPSTVVGAIDIHQRHTLVDVAKAEAGLIVSKLAGIKVKGISLAPALAGDETKLAPS